MRDKLKALDIKKYTKGRYADGGGLFLNVTASGSRSWVLSWKGKNWITATNKHGRREMGLGAFSLVSLSEARTLAIKYRKLISQGIDPQKQRIEERDKEAPKTFEQIGHEFIRLKETGWRNPKHKAQWRMTVDTYCEAIAKKPITEITKTDVLEVINPLWETRHVTAKRVLGRIQNILAYAIAKDIRQAPNPADWKGNIEHLVKEVGSEHKKVKHHAAIDYVDMPAFFAKLQTWEALAAKALTLLILTATRTSETLEAEWIEFDLDAGIWTLPAARTKMQTEHAIPLPDYAIDMLQNLYNNKTSDFVFQGQKPNRPLSNMAMLMLLRRHKIEGVTSHGMRSTFRSWLHDKTSFEYIIGKQSLAHSNPDKVEAAYLRSSAFEKRKQALQMWCDYCRDTSAGNVVALHG